MSSGKEKDHACYQYYSWVVAQCSQHVVFVFRAHVVNSSCHVTTPSLLSHPASSVEQTHPQQASPRHSIVKLASYWLTTPSNPLTSPVIVMFLMLSRCCHLKTRLLLSVWGFEMHLIAFGGKLVVHIFNITKLYCSIAF